MRVSVVIPAYRSAHTIGATLDSVLAQTLQDFEIIVVNDGSPDGAELEEALQPYRGRIIYLSQENQGPAGARNTGIRAARGEHVALLDADDLWEPEHLAAQLAVLEADPSIDVVYADARIIGDVPGQGRTVMELCPSEGEVTFERLVMRQCTVHICVSMARRKTLLEAGLFDPAFRGTEDIDMWLRIVKQGGRIAYQRRVLGSYRRQQGSLSSDRVRMIEGFLAVLAKAASDPLTTAAEQDAIARQCQVQRSNLALEKGRQAFLAGDSAAAIQHLRQANAHYRSPRLAAVLLMLRVAPHFLHTLYHWRDRHIYKLRHAKSH
ncbi:MAG TPA: glycosyltransferase family A protein [Bryobacteraceae bacterium]|nr:glycosyltransferase family A protein [Bryobacteraceae bacterium]